MNSLFPKISIITTSFNQGDFIEKTILSVINQSYPNLEYIIIDGGSKDGSVEIIKKYERELKYWISEKDHGQSDALNKGFSQAGGDIIYWLNSDDYLDNNVLLEVGEVFRTEPVDMVMGKVTVINQNGEVKEIQPNDLFSKLYLFQYWNPFFVPCQPGVFFHRRLLKRNYLVEESLHYGMDHELWLHLMCSNDDVKIKRIERNMAFYLFHDQSKSQNSDSFRAFMPEWKANIDRYLNKLSLFERVQLMTLYNQYRTEGYLRRVKIKLKGKLGI